MTSLHYGDSSGSSVAQERLVLKRPERARRSGLSSVCQMYRDLASEEHSRYYFVFTVRFRHYNIINFKSYLYILSENFCHREFFKKEEGQQKASRVKLRSLALSDPILLSPF